MPGRFPSANDVTTRRSPPERPARLGATRVPGESGRRPSNSPISGLPRRRPSAPVADQLGVSALAGTRVRCRRPWTGADALADSLNPCRQQALRRCRSRRLSARAGGRCHQCRVGRKRGVSRRPRQARAEAAPFRLSTQQSSIKLSHSVLVDFFVSNLWLLCSLLLGLYVLYMCGVKGYTNSIFANTSVGWSFGWQLIFLGFGVFRLVWGMSGLVNKLF